MAVDRGRVMRVLLVVHGFPPEASAGTEVYVHDLALALQRAGDEVQVLTREANAALPELSVRTETREGLVVHLVNNTWTGVRSFEDGYRRPALLSSVLPVLAAFRPEVLHVHHLTHLSTDLVAAAKARGIPVVLTLHDYWLACHRGQRLDRTAQRCEEPTIEGCARCIGAFAAAPRPKLPGPLGRVAAPYAPALRRLTDGVGAGGAAREAAAARLHDLREVLQHVDRVLAPSETMERFFLRQGVAPERMRRTALGVDGRAFEGLRRTPSPRLRLGFVGSLMVSKAPHLLLEAFQRLPTGAAEVVLIGPLLGYHGDDSYRATLEPLLSRPGVRVLGAQPNGAMPALLEGLDVLVVPSIWEENSPVVVREAQLAGLPVIASRLGGLPELVTHERDGLLFEPGSVDALSFALERLLREPDLLPRLRAGLPQPTSINEDARATRAHYAEVVARKGASRKVAAAVLNYRTQCLTTQCVASLEHGTVRPGEVLVVDNGSGDGSAEFLARRLPGCRHLAARENRGYPGGMNLAIREALARRYDAVLLLNSDLTLEPGCLEALLETFEQHPRIGLVAPLLVCAKDGTTVESMGIEWDGRLGRMRHRGFGTQRAAIAPSSTPVVSAAVSGAAVLVRAEVFRRVGLFDESFFHSFEDLELGLRARAAGFQSACRTDVAALHRGAQTIGPDSPRRTYFAVRNHLRLAPALPVLALNSAYALLRAPGRRSAQLAALVLGVWDAAHGRSGSDE